MSQKMLEGLYTKLTAVQTAGTFYDDLSGRIYAIEAPQNASLPLALIIWEDTSVTQSFDTDAIKDALVTIEVWGKREDGGEALGDTVQLLFTLLQNASLTITDHDRGVVTCVSEGSPSMVEDSILISTQWRIRATDFA